MLSLSLSTDSFSGNFWQKLSESPQQESDDVTGGSPHSEEALVVIKSEEEAVLVDVGNDDSTGLLVDIGEGSSPDRVSPTQTAPHVAKIISLEEDWPGDHDEDTALVKGHRKTTSEGNVVTETEVKKENKPVRPAPPKPSPRRSKTVREGKPVPPLRPERKGTSNDLTVPTSPPSGDSETAPMIIISSQRAKTTQRYYIPGYNYIENYIIPSFVLQRYESSTHLEKELYCLKWFRVL